MPSHFSSPHHAGGATPDSVPAALQRITHAAHVRLNQHPLLSGLTRPGYPKDKYITVLAAYYHIYAALESGIKGFLAARGCPFDYIDRVKLPWLLDDLEYFSVDPLAAAWLPARPMPIVFPGNVGALIGTLYAIEGATLGGQVVARHLHESLGLTATSGARFFNGYGDARETQRRWREFGVFAGTIANQPEPCRSAEAAALAVFALINAQLSACHARLEH